MTQYDKEVNRPILIHIEPAHQRGYYKNVTFWNPTTDGVYELRSHPINGLKLEFTGFIEHDNRPKIIENGIYGSVLIKHGIRNLHNNNSFDYYRYRKLMIKNPITNQKYLIQPSAGGSNLVSIYPENIKREKYQPPPEKQKTEEELYLEEENWRFERDLERDHDVSDPYDFLDDYRKRKLTKSKISRKPKRKVVKRVTPKKCRCKK